MWLELARCTSTAPNFFLITALVIEGLAFRVKIANKSLYIKSVARDLLGHLSLENRCQSGSSDDILYRAELALRELDSLLVATDHFLVHYTLNVCKIEEVFELGLHLLNICFIPILPVINFDL